MSKAPDRHACMPVLRPVQDARSLTNIGLDKFGEILERILPAEIARLEWNHVGQAILHDVQLGADRHRPQRYCYLNFSRQIWILESVRETQALIRNQLNICAAE